MKRIWKRNGRRNEEALRREEQERAEKEQALAEIERLKALLDGKRE